MGNLLRDWILPKVLTDGTTAINHDHQVSKRMHQDQELAFEWRSDGSLVIHSFKNSAVQLIEFTHQKYAWISDSHTRLVAYFTKDATAAFKKTHGSSFGSQGGAILTIADYYLTINPSAVPSRRVTLTIQKVKLLGSGGSSTFGKPDKVEEITDVQDLILRIQQSSPVQSRLADPATRSLSPVFSQADRVSDGVNFGSQSPATQNAFATQVFQAPRPHLEFDKQVNSRTEHSAQTRRDQSDVLLSLLAQSRKETVLPTRNDLLSGLKPSVDSTTVNHSTTPLRSPSKSRITKNTSEIESIANIQKSSSFPGSKVRDIGKIQENSNYATQSLISIEIDNDNNSARMNTALIAPEPKNQRLSPQVDEVGSSHGAYLLSLWEKHTHISRRFVQIPTDQRSLLQRDDSWVYLRKQSGLRVPPPVLLHLHAFHDRTASSAFNNKTGQHKRDAIEEDEVRNDVPLSNQAPNENSQSSTQNLHGAVAEHTNIENGMTEPDENSDDGSEPALSWSNSPPEQRKSTLRQGHEVLGNNDIIPSFDVHTSLERSSSPESCASSNSEETKGHRLQASPILPPLREWDSTRHPAAMLFSPYVEERIEEPPQTFSSSSIEMEVAVPYGIDDQITSSAVIGAEVNRQFEIAPSTNEKQRPNLQVIRTPHNKARSSQSHCFPESRDIILNTDKNTFMTGTVSHSSDSVIPGTIDVDGTAIQVPSTGALMLPGTNSSVDVQRSTITQNRPSLPATYIARSSMTHSSPLSGTDEDTTRSREVFDPCQSHTKMGNLVSQDEGVAKDTKAFNYTSNTQTINTPKANGSRISSSNPTSSHALVLATQMPDVSRQAVFPSKVGEPLAKHSEVEFSQVDRPFVNTAQMIKANRHAFMDDLALQDPTSFVTNSDSGAFFKPPSYSRRPIKKLRLNSGEQATFDQAMRDSSPTTPLEQANLPSSKVVNTTIDANDAILHNADSDEVVISLYGQSSEELVPLQHPCLTFQNKNCEFPRGQPRITHSPNVTYQNSLGLVSAESHSREPMSTVFDRYRASYPAFTATQKRFIAACVYLEFLKQEKNAAPHPMLWDDFIRAFCHDYRVYVKECRNSGDSPMVGIDFYNEKVFPDPIYAKRIVSQCNLNEILLSDPTETQRIRDKFLRTPQTGSLKGDDALASATSYFKSLNSITTPLKLGVPCSQPSSTPKTTKPIENEEDIQPIPGENSKYNGNHDPETDFVVIANQQARRKPFFETPSQLVTNPIDTAAFVPIHDTEDVCKGQSATRQPSESWVKRRLPWSSSPGGAQDVVPLVTEKEKQQRKFSGSNNASSSKLTSTSLFQANSGRGSFSPNSPTSQNRYSPILENRSAQSFIAALDTIPASGGSPILGSRIFPSIFPDQERLRTPELPVRRSTSGGLRALDNIIFDHQSITLSVPAKRKASPVSSSKPTKRLSWAAFSTSYESRKTRLSTASNSTSVLSSVISSSGADLSSVVGFEHTYEPET